MAKYRGIIRAGGYKITGSAGSSLHDKSAAIGRDGGAKARATFSILARPPPPHLFARHRVVHGEQDLPRPVARQVAGRKLGLLHGERREGRGGNEVNLFHLDPIPLFKVRFESWGMHSSSRSRNGGPWAPEALQQTDAFKAS